MNEVNEQAAPDTLDRRLASLSPEQREVLMRKLKERGADVALSALPALPAITERPRIPDGPVDRFAPVPPTDFQEVLWLGRSGIFDLGGCGSNVYIELEIPGAVYPFAASLNEGLRDVIARHEMLRTVIRPDGRLQLLAEVPPYEVEVEDLSARSEAWIEERLGRVRDELRYARRPLDRWPLFTIVAHQIKEGKIRLHARFEAAVIDGTGRSVLIHELAMRINFPDRELAPVDVSFLDYARALADFRETATYARSRAYWLARLPTLPPPPILPLARPLAPDTVPRIVKRQPEVLDAESWQALCRRARRAGLSPTSAVTAAFADVLRLWSARPDFTVGFGGAYQPDVHPHMARAVGTFTIIHLLALQNDPGTFLERARQLQSRVNADLEHQEFSGHQVWRAYNRLHRTGARALLPIHFNSVVEYGHAPAAETTPDPAAEESGERPIQLIFEEIELMISLPQALILWVANENADGGLELVSQAVEEVFPEGFLPDLIEAYRDLLARLAAGDAAWHDVRPARRVGELQAPEPWLADLAGALGYGAHPRFVESALERHPAVRQAAVWSAGEEGRGPLTAWIVCDGRTPGDEDLRRHLRATLPEHLVPSAFVRVERLPLATDGTVDRGALPAPPEPPVGEWGELERELATLWEEVLGRRPAALSDDFFALGGDSVSAVRLLARLAARWGDRVVPGELFAQPTLAGHAAAVRRGLAPVRPSARERLAGALSGLLESGRRLVAPAVAPAADRTRTGASFGLRIYMILWIGQTISNLGTSLGAFALGVWMFQTTHSTTMFSGMMLSATLTALATAPFAGSITDRVDRRSVLLFANLTSCLMTLLMAAALYTGQMKPWYCYVVASVMTGVGVFQGSAFVASASMLLPRRMLMRTSSMSQTAATITSMLGPLLAGILVSRISYHGVILIDTGTFLIATLSVLLVRIPRPAPSAGRERGHLLHDAALGWNYIRQRPGLFRLLILFGASNFSIGIVQALLTPLILSFATPQELGAVEFAGAFGLLLGGLGLIVWGGPRNRILGILAAFAAQALILLLGGLQPSVPLVTLAVFAFMLASPIIVSGSQAIWQSKVELGLQGRVFAIRSVIAAGAMPFAFAIAGPLADRVFEPLMAPGGGLAGTVGALIGVGKGRGVGLLFIVLGLFVLLVVLLSALSPRLWKIESEIPDAVADSEDAPDLSLPETELPQGLTAKDPTMSTPKITIVGAGLGGSLLGIYLARRGWEVNLFERRGDLRRELVETGRSIKLTLAERGLSALRELGLEEHVKRNICIALRRRAIHSSSGAITHQPYGKNDDEVIHSFSRNDLNGFLLDVAEREPNLRLHFHHSCVEIEKETAAAVFRDPRTNAETRVEADVLIGADGAFSTVRRQMIVRERVDFSQQFLAWGYKELTIDGTAEGLPPMDRHALHIWPCGDHMLFALPNLDGSLCGVCTLPFSGPHSFESFTDAGAIETMFRTHFPDVVPYMPNALAEFQSRPISELITIRTSKWHHKGKVLVIGDAAHSVIPFYGQGMNAAFEDCSILNRLIDTRGTGDWQALFAEFQALRKPNTDVLSQLSVANFFEMQDTARRPLVTARKRTSIFLNKLFRQHSMPLYTMISHTTIPYAEAVERHRRQEKIARWMGLDLVVGAVSLHVRLRAALARRRALRQAKATTEGRQEAAAESL